MRAKNLSRMLAFSFESSHEPVLVKGAPGIGKTEIIKQAAKKVRWQEFYKNFTGHKSPELLTKISKNMVGADLIITHPVVADPTDYKGLPFIVDGEADFHPFGELKRLIKAKRPTIFFMDDLGQATPAVQSAGMQLLLERRINGHMVSDHVVFVAATNRREDRANVSGILEPVKSRFKGGIFQLDVNHDDWIEWAWKNNMPNELISFIQMKPNMLFNHKPTRDIENSPSPRTNEAVGNALNHSLPEDLRYDAFKGLAGETYAVEFSAYLKVFMMLPTITEIVSNPNGARLPDEASARFAVMGMIVDKMDDENIRALQTYLKRLGDEMLTAAMVNASKRHPKLLNTSEFTNWAIQNGQELANLM